MNYITIIIIPMIILFIVLYGMVKGVKIYECFIDGAKDGIHICLKIFPYLLAMILAVGIFRQSGVMEYFIKIIRPVVKYIDLPAEVAPLILIKPLSGSGAIGVFTEVLKQYGADSYIGRIASVVMGSTETIFYTLTVYYGAVGIKKIRHTLWAAIIADLTAIIMAVVMVKLVFY